MNPRKHPGLHVVVLISLALGASGVRAEDSGLPGIAGGKIAEMAAGLAPGGVAQEAIVTGLREMLKLGAENTVNAAGRTDGFLKDDEIRIPLPAALVKPATTLRSMQLGALVDDLEVAMNRAAEEAAAEALPVFQQAIETLEFDDAAGILAGSERAATDFFQQETSDALTERFRPIVEKRMQEVGVAKVYQSLTSKLSGIPFMSAPAVDLEAHVTAEALSGLFVVLAREEARVRTDPAARTSPALAIFGD